ncbi:PdxT/SNO family [Melampsora americana]|nr:PdxT/SNO family [Melampsora americana]
MADSNSLPILPSISTQSPITIGVLALQGAYAEHISHLRRLASSFPASSTTTANQSNQPNRKLLNQFTTIQVKTAKELERCHGLIIPGGESTAISLIASRQIDESGFSLLDWLKSFVKTRSVWGTCAGMILLSDEVIEGSMKKGGQELLGGLPIIINRNQWGRQTESFEHELQIDGIRDSNRAFPGIFIRAPVIHTIKSTEQIKTLTSVPISILPNSNQFGPDAQTVAIQKGRLLATSFHPELSQDSRLHEFWLLECVLPNL